MIDLFNGTIDIHTGGWMDERKRREYRDQNILGSIAKAAPIDAAFIVLYIVYVLLRARTL